MASRDAETFNNRHINQELDKDFCASRDDIAPLFVAEAYIRGQSKRVNLEDLRGHYVALVFYSSDFTFV
jgi:hypothetical protein